MDSEQRDHLISRVVDRCESAADWEALSAFESEHNGVWRELAQALRCEAELRDAMAIQVARADQVSLPPSSKSNTRRPLPTWSGWLAAAACVIAWALSSLSDPAAAIATHSPVEKVAQAAPEEPATQNTADHSVITELPMLVVDTKPAVDGDGYEVIYLRRVLETRRVDQVMQLAVDEGGSLRPVPVDHSELTRPEAL